VREKGQLSAKLLDKLVGSAPVAPDAAVAAATGGAASAPGAAANTPAPTPGFLANLKAKHVTRHTLADLSLLASHPFIVVTLLHSLLSAFEQAVEQDQTPREHAQTRPLTDLLHLALSPCAELLLPEGELPSAPLQLPEPPQAEALYSDFYPLIAELIIYAQLGEMEPLNPKLSVFST
jgi:hypothetical protein